MQFGSHYTLFRQDRRTNVRSEVAKASSYETAVCASLMNNCGSGTTCSVQACDLQPHRDLRGNCAAAQGIFAVSP